MIGVLVALTGCTAQEVDGNRFRCAVDDDCGAGWVCRWEPGAVQGVCAAAGGLGDGGESDGGADADGGEMDDGWDANSGALPCEADGECPKLPAGGCMESMCHMGQCVVQAIAAGAACDDGDACTVGDGCNEGVCTGAPRVCNDGNPCTADGCNTKVGCQHIVKIGGACDDGNGCTEQDVCGEGSCKGVAKICDDGNPCTVDGCNEAVGCQHTAVTGGACDDGDTCTEGDGCITGQCLGLGGLDCDDGNPCTNDACDSLVGCTHVSNEVPCDDDNACTLNDKCTAAVCASAGMIHCYDGNACTEDWCDVKLGCQSAPILKSCDDDDVCTLNDNCAGGACVGSGQLGCGDGNPCTDDACDSQTGCVNTNTSNACDDGSACTVGDQCSGGACKAGAATNCNDWDPCTTDTCLTSTGCNHTKIAGCSVDMVDVPAGAFWMGCNSMVDTECSVFSNESPQHSVTLSAYQIDIWEVTVAAWDKCVAAGNCQAKSDGDCWWGTTNYGKKGKSEYPMNCVTWSDAAAFCAWAGKRLCSEAEWEKAARGGCEKYPGQTCATAMPRYPWGNTNPGPSTPKYGNFADEVAKQKYTDLNIIAGYNDGYADTAPVGSFAAGVSPYGALDMIGNVMEWVDDCWHENYAGAPTNGSAWISGCIGPYRVIRGGSFIYSAGAYLRASCRHNEFPYDSKDVLGLRCCRSIE